MQWLVMLLKIDVCLMMQLQSFGAKGNFVNLVERTSIFRHPSSITLSSPLLFPCGYITFKLFVITFLSFEV